MDVDVLTDKQRQKVISKLSSKLSDNEIADKCGVSRSTVWRIRQGEAAKQAKLKKAQSRMEKKRQLAEATKPTQPAVQVSKTIMVRAPNPSSRQHTSAGAAIPPEPPTGPIRIVPKVDVEPVNMANYFAVQILRGESVRDVAYEVMKAAEAEGILFRKLQTLDCISVGTAAFARFRSDLVDLATCLKTSARGFIAFSDGCYRVTFPDGRQGVKYPTTVMLSSQRAGYGQTFAGPRIARWAQQFTRAN